MAGKPKVQVAREHLTKAQEEAVMDDLRDAIGWSFASLEAAIHALAEGRGIDIDQKHWKRTDAARQLHEAGVLPRDLSELHALLNQTRKATVYEGEDPDLGEWSSALVIHDFFSLSMGSPATTAAERFGSGYLPGWVVAADARLGPGGDDRFHLATASRWKETAR